MFGISLSQCVAVMLPPPTAIDRFHYIDGDIMGTLRNSLRPASVINNRPDKILYTEEKIDELYKLAGQYMDGSMDMKELVAELRGGDIQDWVGAFGIIMAIITILSNVDAFQVPPAPGAIPLPHLEWLYGNKRPENHFGYGKGAGPRSITVTGATQNAGSEKKQPSDGSWNYIDVMLEFKKQSNKKWSRYKSPIKRILSEISIV